MKIAARPCLRFECWKASTTSTALMLWTICARFAVSTDSRTSWSGWVAGRQEQWRGIVYSDVIFAAGFAIFVLSDFPPTQRFGEVVLAGLLIDILANLFVLPLLGGAEWKNKKV